VDLSLNRPLIRGRCRPLRGNDATPELRRDGHALLITRWARHEHGRQSRRAIAVAAAAVLVWERSGPVTISRWMWPSHFPSMDMSPRRERAGGRTNEQTDMLADSISASILILPRAIRCCPSTSESTASPSPVRRTSPRVVHPATPAPIPPPQPSSVHPVSPSSITDPSKKKANERSPSLLFGCPSGGPCPRVVYETEKRHRVRVGRVRVSQCVGLFVTWVGRRGRKISDTWLG